MPDQQGVGADPGRVIDILSARIGEQAKQMAIAEDVIRIQREEIERLKAQLPEQS